ncbi:MAG: hypothetical protein RLZZ157_1722, partial [Pseudomonadota bacterium]
EKKKRIKLAVPKEPLMVVGDRDEMAQVVINLLDNALKYSRPDSVVAVSTHAALPRDTAIQTAMRQWPLAARLPLTSPPVDQDRLYGVLRVEDQGDGIAAQHLPRLAERFYRVEITASGKSGTGLGLAIVKHIVNRHRGGLVVESQPAHGTAFSVYLPQPED